MAALLAAHRKHPPINRKFAILQQGLARYNSSTSKLRVLDVVYIQDAA
jgi:hypothetical protein